MTFPGTRSLYPRRSRFRQQRMRDFVERFRPGADTRILDVGGTDLNWRLVDVESEIVLLNTVVPSEGGPLPPNMRYQEGDARSLPFADGAFDICFSNSTIEHLHTLENQRRFASEIRRVGRGLYVQTPARSFPFEPHWVGLFVHWLPKGVQRRVARRLTLYGLLRRPTPETVAALVDEYRLLTLREMRELFPDCVIRRERFAGLTKAYVAIRGAQPVPAGAASPTVRAGAPTATA